LPAIFTDLLKRGDKRWFKRGGGRRQVDGDPGVRRDLLDDVRQRFGMQVQAPFADQAAAVVQVLQGDDGLLVAAEVLREFAEAAHAEMWAQTADLQRRTGRLFAFDRRNYRPLWREAGQGLRWPLFALPGNFHPYVQVTASVTVIGAQARRAVRITDPRPLLAQMFEVLDLMIDGWEFGRVRVDVDGATLAESLVVTARAVIDAMGDPPPLPDAVRELMRRNKTVDVYDATGRYVMGGFNPGKTLRETLLV
jgi:hypothetical protein